MDPQQRLLLEASWEALEHAGIDPASLQRSSTGVFVGTSSQTYASLVLDQSESAEGYMTTGIAGSMVSGRVAHSFGFEGPVASVDAACASSALAIHLACQALRAEECSMALAGGVAVSSTPLLHLQFPRQNLFSLAEDGRCKSFADAADGTCLSEGLGLVVLERLTDAKVHGHPVLATIRGSAANHDGPSNGLTAPNGLSHERVIREALSKAHMPAARIDVVEAHGIGTVLGDPIEAEALLATYGQEREPERPFLLGSIKSNLGHTLAAGGVAGVIKMVLSMEKGLIPQTLHVDKPTRHVDWSSGAVRLLTEVTPWPTCDGRRYAAVHSFGMSGTNVHIVLEGETSEGDSTPPRKVRMGLGSGGSRSAIPWLISATDQDGLRRQIQRLGDFVKRNSALSLEDAAYSLAVFRPHLPCRIALLSKNREQLLHQLESAEANLGEGLGSGFVRRGTGSAFFFANDADRSLIDLFAARSEFPEFAQVIQRCDEVLSPVIGWPLLGELQAATARATFALRIPETFSLQVATAAALRAWGVEPIALLGSRCGEISAAFTAGLIGLTDAAEVIASTLDVEGRTRTWSVDAQAPEFPCYASTGLLIASIEDWGIHREDQRRPRCSGGPSDRSPSTRRYWLGLG